MLRKLCGLTVALATVSVAPVASAQVWSEHKGGGLLLNNKELKQTVRNGSLENAVSMNKYALVFQHDYNLCIQTWPGMQYRRCISDEGANYSPPRKLIYKNVQLRALDANGQSVWETVNPNDPTARLMFAYSGKLVSISADGKKQYWAWPEKY